ncbi:manganese peroxidase [Datura stramonium]|uniref:Manganese peroxidase n=1 Tax=Datura stramonium TaxID=4076 RepID=A0ABS8T2K4_DATST|nr:manganese peroxidase [Datura stramonium]
MEDIQSQQQPTEFDPTEEEQVIGAIMDDREIFLDGNGDEHHFDVNDGSIFYADFPPLPDFPCMSSSSSTCSAPSLAKPFPTSSSASSSNSAASWAVLKSDVEEDVSKKIQPPATSMEDEDCFNDLGYMNMMDGNEFWDPNCTLFQSDQNPVQDYNNMSESFQLPQDDNEERNKAQIEDDGLSFFQEDMRSIKLKRSAIASASKRLGGTKEGKKQLLRLILEWVSQYQLQKKRMSTDASDSLCQYQHPNPNPNPKSHFQYNTVDPDPSACFYPTPPGPFYLMPTGAGFVGCNGPSFTPTLSQTVINGNMEYQSSTMAASQYNPLIPENDCYFTTNATPHDLYSPYPYQLFDENGERLVRLGSSATKEARKKRMARQRHHYRHHTHQTEHQSQSSDQSLRMVGENCTMFPADNPGNWVYWPSAAPSPLMMVPPPEVPPTIEETPEMQQPQKHGSADERLQGWKMEKNLKFLLQKMLKQSDVGNLGRIVLPKREAESHLPELVSRDGISIAMEDIGTSRVWNMKYRFWPNNKSTMYLLENTGDFVRANGLQEGDFIVIYADTKCGKYGVKVRQTGPKAEGKKPAKKNARNSSSAANSSSVAAMKQLMK